MKHNNSKHKLAAGSLALLMTLGSGVADLATNNNLSYAAKEQESESSLDSIKNEIAEIDARITANKEKLAAVQEKYSQNYGELEANKRNNARLEPQLEVINEQIERKKAEKAKIEANTELSEEDKRNEIASRDAFIEEQTYEKNILVEKIRDIHGLEQELENLQAEKEELQKLINDDLARKAILQDKQTELIANKASDKNKELDDLQAKLSKSEEESKKYAEELNKYKEANDQYAKEIQELKDKSSKAAAETIVIQSKIDEVKAQLEELQKSLVGKSFVEDNKAEDGKKDEQEKTQAQKELEDLKKELEALKKQKEEAKDNEDGDQTSDSSVEDLNKKLTETEAKVAELTAKVEVLDAKQKQIEAEKKLVEKEFDEAMKSLKSKSLAIIDTLSELKDEQAKDFKAKIEKATTAKEIDTLLDQAKSANDKNKEESQSQSLDKAKFYAKSVIDLTLISDMEKAEYKSKIEAATTAKELDELVQAAKDKSIQISKGQVEKPSDDKKPSDNKKDDDKKPSDDKKDDDKKDDDKKDEDKKDDGKKEDDKKDDDKKDDNKKDENKKPKVTIEKSDAENKGNKNSSSGGATSNGSGSTSNGSTSNGSTSSGTTNNSANQGQVSTTDQPKTGSTQEEDNGKRKVTVEVGTNGLAFYLFDVTDMKGDSTKSGKELEEEILKKINKDDFENKTPIKTLTTATIDGKDGMIEFEGEAGKIYYLLPSSANSVKADDIVIAVPGIENKDNGKGNPVNNGSNGALPQTGDLSNTTKIAGGFALAGLLSTGAYYYVNNLKKKELSQQEIDDIVK